MYLMPADGHQVNSKTFWDDLVLAICLNCIHMKDHIRIFLLCHGNKLFDILHGSHLIVDHHNGH